jgi:hypothetical protein
MLRRGSGQRGGQQIKAEVGIRNRRPWGEHERIGLEPCRERLGCDVDERIVRRPGLVGDFAQQSGRVGGEIDEPDRPSAILHRRGDLVRGSARQTMPSAATLARTWPVNALVTDPIRNSVSAPGASFALSARRPKP